MIYTRDTNFSERNSRQQRSDKAHADTRGKVYRNEARETSMKQREVTRKSLGNVKTSVQTLLPILLHNYTHVTPRRVASVR